MSRRRLGRGLDALLSAASEAEQGESPVTGNPGSDLTQLALDDIHPSRYQPRQHFDPDRLAELADSIRRQGLMQPVVVRERAQGGYELVAGERRWRAAQLAGLAQIPAVLKRVTDEQASAMALIENIQREDLNPLEEATALDRLRNEFGLTQQQVAEAVGKSRVAVTNLLRLLNLTPAVRELLAAGRIEMGHARALLSLEALAQERLALRAAEDGLSVRQIEALVRRELEQSGSPGSRSRQRPAAGDKSADTRRLEQELTDRIGAPVSITANDRGAGQLAIRFTSLDELDGILGHLR